MEVQNKVESVDQEKSDQFCLTTQRRSRSTRKPSSPTAREGKAMEVEDAHILIVVHSI